MSRPAQLPTRRHALACGRFQSGSKEMTYLSSWIELPGDCNQDERAGMWTRVMDHILKCSFDKNLERRK